MHQIFNANAENSGRARPHTCAREGTLTRDKRFLEKCSSWDKAVVYALDATHWNHSTKISVRRSAREDFPRARDDKIAIKTTAFLGGKKDGKLIRMPSNWRGSGWKNSGEMYLYRKANCPAVRSW